MSWPEVDLSVLTRRRVDDLALFRFALSALRTELRAFSELTGRWQEAIAVVPEAERFLLRLDALEAAGLDPADRIFGEIADWITDLAARDQVLRAYHLDWAETKPFIEPLVGFRIQ
jgi:hypothetical protein